MAGAMKIYECSASMAGTDKTSGTVRFKLADDATVNQSNPMTIPSDNYVRPSYTKHLRFYCATAPSQKIDNLQAYSDGSNTFGAGISVNASVGSGFNANATTWGGGADLFGYDSGTPLNMDAYHTASVNATGFCGDLLKLQLKVASPASPGALSPETLTFSYDEI